jgi:hypothetical protein
MQLMQMLMYSEQSYSMLTNRLFDVRLSTLYNPHTYTTV